MKFRAFPAKLSRFLHFSYSLSIRLPLTLPSPAFLMCFIQKGKTKKGWEMDLGLGLQFLYINLRRFLLFFLPNVFSIHRYLSSLPKSKATYSRMLSPKLKSCELRVPAVKWSTGDACCCDHIPVEADYSTPGFPSKHSLPDSLPAHCWGIMWLASAWFCQCCWIHHGSRQPQLDHDSFSPVLGVSNHYRFLRG